MSSIKLKVCGVTSVSEAKQLIDVGVDYIGVNFIMNSVRCVSIETAESIAAIIKGSNTKLVALFRDQPIELVNTYSSRLSADFVQLHGSESISYVKKVDTPVFKAISVNPEVAFVEILDCIAKFQADYFVLDRQQQGRGDMVNTKIADQVVQASPNRIFLAGGLTPDNLTEAIARVHPYGVDISSGVRTNYVLDMAKVIECLRITKSKSAY